MCETAELFPWIAVFAVEFLVIIIGNTITIFAFWKLRSVLKRTYYLLINLTIADVTVGLGVIKLVTSNILRLNTNEEPGWARYIAMDVFFWNRFNNIFVTHRCRTILRHCFSISSQGID